MDAFTQRQVLMWSGAALLIGGLFGYAIGMSGTPVPSTPTSTTSVKVVEGEPAAPGAILPPQEKLRTELRVAMDRLWEDHITWTRQYIISVADNTKDGEEVAARLMKNQEDIGAAVGRYYGQAAGNQLTALLKQHIEGAVEILAAAKKKDKDGMEAAIARWRVNGDAIAGFLSDANPQHWPLVAMQDAMTMHLDTTLAEATARLEGRHADDIKAYDAVKEHIYLMSGILTDGIIQQFPDKF